VRADVFLLKQGGRLEGALQNPEEVPRQSYVVKTESGAVVTLERTQVARVVHVRPAEAEYEKIRGRYPDTAEGQWELAEWCKAKNLGARRNAHLERVVELDPEHVPARRALGYGKIDGKWQTANQRQANQGYIKHNGKWMTQQQIDLLNEQKDFSAKEKEWVQKVKLWVSWLPTDRARIAEEKLLAVKDPLALKGLAMALDAMRDRPTQSLLIRAIAKLDIPEAAETLAACSMYDPDEDIRAACLDVLKLRKTPPLIEYYVGFLRNKSNYMVNRAGVALKEMEDPSAIEPLINALVTVHKFKIAQNPNAINSTFGTGPGGSGAPGGGGGGLSVGAKAPKIVSQAIQNRSVLDALVKITGVNYTFDLAAWRTWYLAHKKRAPVDGRRG
jgi:hypothetical protein